MKLFIWVDIRDELPCPNRPVVAMNYHHGWEELSMFKEGRFWIMEGVLKGKELPFVQAWRYVNDEDKSYMERSFCNN